MDAEAFIRIEKVEDGRKRHYVVNRFEPGFSLEVDPPNSGLPGRPAIRSVRLPNSWTGDYHRFSKLVAGAQSFLERCEGLVATGRRFPA